MKIIHIRNAILLLCCFPVLCFPQANINNGTNVSKDVAILPWTGFQVYNSPTYSMDDFVDNEDYRLIVTDDSPNFCYQIYAAINAVTIGGLMETFDQVDFVYHDDDVFSLGFKIPSSTSPGQTQLLKFEIRRKIAPGIWDWQSTFFYYVNTTCAGSYTLNTGTLGANDYEVSDHLTVSVPVSVSSGVAELDGGQSVLLQPGFTTTVSGSGSVLIINDGCGGSYRPASPAHPTGVSTTGHALKAGITAYPSPFRDELSVEIPEAGAADLIGLEVRDINGRLLLEEKKQGGETLKLRLSHLERGLYFITARGSHFTYHYKIIKE